MFFYFVLVSLLLSQSAAQKCQRSSGMWSWECRQERCVKVKSSETTTAFELNTCKLTCGPYSMLFPKPSGFIKLANRTVPFLPNRVKLNLIKCASKPCSVVVTDLIGSSFDRFLTQLNKTLTKHSSSSNISFKCKQEATQRKVQIYFEIKTNITNLNLHTDESYSLSINASPTLVTINITANTFFGARHALETVSQLTAYQKSHDSLQIVDDVLILDDKPAYTYRGMLLDTARNFFSVESIKRLITAMSYNKMNTLHWHITDTHSFPIEIKSLPKMHQYGAYTPEKVYLHDDVSSIVSHGRMHGVRVMPEFDEPAHCGEGWQWGEKSGLGQLAVCVKKEPWESYCSEPPCGQLNPINENLYDVLGKIYNEYFRLFSPDIFHAGGDEINFNCWNTTKEITDWLIKTYGGVEEEDFMNMWGRFVKKSTKKLLEANNGTELPIILWSSKMTIPKYLTRYLDPKKYVIQIWSLRNDKNIPNIVKKGFRTIFSTYDTLYLDCGYGNWLTKGNNWCSPYKDWKLFYDNDPVKILERLDVTVTKAIRRNILGQEAAMWSEQVDEEASEGKIWPRVSALAERLWSNPKHNWTAAEYRLIYHRERMVERGVKADALQPLWCEQNAGHCYIKTKHSGDYKKTSSTMRIETSMMFILIANYLTFFYLF